jgi:hypothetical protein
LRLMPSADNLGRALRRMVVIWEGEVAVAALRVCGVNRLGAVRWLGMASLAAVLFAGGPALCAPSVAAAPSGPVVEQFSNNSATTTQCAGTAAQQHNTQVTTGKVVPLCQSAPSAPAQNTPLIANAPKTTSPFKGRVSNTPETFSATGPATGTNTARSGAQRPANRGSEPSLFGRIPDRSYTPPPQQRPDLGRDVQQSAGRNIQGAKQLYGALGQGVQTLSRGKIPTTTGDRNAESNANPIVRTQRTGTGATAFRMPATTTNRNAQSNFNTVPRGTTQVRGNITQKTGKGATTFQR